MKFNYLLKCKILLEAFQAEGLTESMKVAPEIVTILSKYGLEVPTEEIDKITSITIDPNNHTKFKVDWRGKTDDSLAITKVLAKLFPDKMNTSVLNDQTIKQIISEIKNAITQTQDDYEFRIEDDVVDGYETCLEGSCMQGETHLTKFYNILGPENVQILMLYKNGQPIARALLWHNIQAAEGGNFMDRIYPPGISNIEVLFHDYARKQGWSYRKRSSMDADVGRNITFQIPKDKLKILFDTKQLVPYMDTFVYGNSMGLFSNNQIEDTMTKLQNSDGSILFVHIPNPWLGGTWEGGTWNGGTWEDGTWEMGTWIKGTWNGGKWEQGRWKNGTWNGGKWKYGIWENGTWNNGIWKYGKWVGGTWNGGEWELGLIYDPNKEGKKEYVDTLEWDTIHIGFVRAPEGISPDVYFGQPKSPYTL